CSVLPLALLTRETDVRVEGLDGAAPQPAVPPPAALGDAARVLAGAERPLAWAGSGVLLSGAWGELRAVAEALRAPVVTSYMGKGAFPEDHGLSAGSACDEAGLPELVAGADCG